MIRALLAAVGTEHQRPVRRLLTLLVGAAVLQGVAFALLVPLLRAVLTGASPWWWLAGVLVAAAAHLTLAAHAQNSAFATGAAVARRLHHRLGDAVVSIPLAWFDRARTGSLVRVAGQSVLGMMSLPAHQLRPLVTAVVVPVTVLVTVAVLDPPLALALGLGALVLGVVLRVSNTLVARSDRARDAVIAEAGERIVEFARAQPELRAFGRMVDGHRALDDALVAQHDGDRRMVAMAVPGLVGFAFTVRVVLTAALALAANQALTGRYDVATVLAVIVLVVRFAEAIGAGAEQGASLRTSRNALDRITAVLDEAPLPEPVAPRSPIGTDVEFDHVTFGYASGAPALRDVSFTAGPGLTALVGPSGAGKTTVARLLARFADPDAGAVRIGGVDLRDIDPAELVGLVSTVFQDVYLFEGTLAENVRLGRPDADAEDLARAARLAGLDPVLAELPDGWDTRVGEAGATLSGGQRQRVSIARALLKDAPIVVLDEATAALDPETDAIIGAAVTALARERTVFVIAHRLRTVQDADRIVVLRDGAITESGRHAELLAADGTYAAFVAQRRRAAGWRLVPAAGS